MPDRIQIEGFKSLRAVDLELRPLNVLVGANGAGKSNIVQILRGDRRGAAIACRYPLAAPRTHTLPLTNITI